MQWKEWNVIHSIAFETTTKLRSWVKKNNNETTTESYQEKKTTNNKNKLFIVYT